MTVSETSASVAFEICASVESGTVIVKELASLLRCDSTALHRGCHPAFEIAHEFFRIVFHIVENIGHGLAVDDLRNFVAIFRERDVHGVGVAEQVVEVSQDLLIGSDEEHSEIIWLVGFEIVHAKAV